jgi:hypothetical protein
LRVVREGKTLDVELRPGLLGASLSNRAVGAAKAVPQPDGSPAGR